MTGFSSIYENESSGKNSNMTYRLFTVPVLLGPEQGIGGQFT